MMKEIKAGIKFLDKHCPNWLNFFDAKALDNLDIREPDKCILGTIYNDYVDGLADLGLTDAVGYALGFNSDADITEYWREAILNLKKGGIKTYGDLSLYLKNAKDEFLDKDIPPRLLRYLELE